MAVPTLLLDYAHTFNESNVFWSVTKARAIKATVLNEIVNYHDVLRQEFIATDNPWDPNSRQDFADIVAPGSNAAWGRELKTLLPVV